MSYAAPAGCSNRDAFVRELARRTTRVQVVDASATGARFVVELLDRGQQILGMFHFVEPNGAETARAVSGATCDEVVPALALIAAVLVDPESVTRARATPVAPAPPVSPGQARSLRLRPSFGTGAGVSSALGPGVSLAPLVELGLESELGEQRGPALALTVARFVSPTRSTSAGDADFTTTFGRLRLCPLRWPATGPLFGSACGALEAGTLRAKGSRTADERSYSSLWLAVDPALALEYRPLRALGMGLGAFGVFPLVRDRYFFGPNVPVFSVPAAGVTVEASVRVVLF